VIPGGYKAWLSKPLLGRGARASMDRARLEETIERVRLLLEAVSRGEYCCLRFGLPFVTPSLLASQVFCEKKLEYTLINEHDPGARRISEARKLVEVLFEAKRRIPRHTDTFVLSIPVAAVVEGVPIIARPHAVYFDAGRVAAIVVGKISTKPWRMYGSDKVKLYAYALTLAYAGFPLTSRTELILAAAEDNRKLIGILSSVDLSSVKPIADNGAALHVLVHDLDAELEAISPLLAYWREERKPTARRGSWCTRCPYYGSCYA